MAAKHRDDDTVEETAAILKVKRAEIFSLLNEDRGRTAMITKVYAGMIDPYTEERLVHIVENGDSRDLPLRLDLINYDAWPDGFSWGRDDDPGAAQLALALLADVFGNDKLAVKLHQGFKFRVINCLDHKNDWQMTHASITAALHDRTLQQQGEPK